MLPGYSKRGIPYVGKGTVIIRPNLNTPRQSNVQWQVTSWSDQMLSQDCHMNRKTKLLNLKRKWSRFRNSCIRLNFNPIYLEPFVQIQFRFASDIPARLAWRRAGTTRKSSFCSSDRVADRFCGAALLIKCRTME